jgi:hypothetical protein
MKLFDDRCQRTLLALRIGRRGGREWIAPEVPAGRRAIVSMDGGRDELFWAERC